MKLLIILMLAAGMWILQYLFRDAEEEQPQQRRRAPRDRARQPGASTARRRSASDLDRFLEEARRRRQGGNAPRREEEPIVEAELVEEPIIRPSQRPAPRSQPPSLPPFVPMEQSQPTPAQLVSNLPTEEELQEQRRAQEKRFQELEMRTSASGTGSAPAQSTTLQEVVALIGTHGFNTAMVLHEVLSKPLCRRDFPSVPANR